MKSPLALVLAFVSVLPAYGDLVITEKVSNAGQIADITVKVGTDKLRTDMGAQMSTITDLNTGVVTTLMPAQKIYMVIDQQASQAMMQQMKQSMQSMGATAAGGPPPLVATGKSQKIDGYNALEYKFTNGNMSGTYWIAPDYPNAKAIAAAMLKFQQGGLASLAKQFAPDLSKIDGVAMKSEIDLNGQRIDTELESAMDEAVDPSVYQVPADYKEMKMPSMPAQ